MTERRQRQIIELLGAIESILRLQSVIIAKLSQRAYPNTCKATGTQSEITVIIEESRKNTRWIGTSERAQS